MYMWEGCRIPALGASPVALEPCRTPKFPPPGPDGALESWQEPQRGERHWLPRPTAAHPNPSPRSRALLGQGGEGEEINFRNKTVVRTGGTASRL